MPGAEAATWLVAGAEGVGAAVADGRELPGQTTDFDSSSGTWEVVGGF